MTVNTLVDTSFVRVDGLPDIRALEVQAVSYTTKGMYLSRIPTLSAFLLRYIGGEGGCIINTGFVDDTCWQRCVALASDLAILSKPQRSVLSQLLEGVLGA